MNEMKHRKMLADITPDVPEKFHATLCSTLEQIVAQEKNGASLSAQMNAAHIAWRRRRMLVVALLAALLLCTAALAARHWKLFDTLSLITGPAPTTADEVMQGDLGKQTVNGVEIAVEEAGYDGRTLFLRYTYRMPDVDTPLGAYRNGGTGDGVSEEDMRLLSEHHVGWWIDHLWINGQCVDMPDSSGAITSGSATPGELVQTEYWRLDHVELHLSGKVEIALPIGEIQPLEQYSLLKHPEMYDENGLLKLPEKGMVTFTLDTADTLAKVRVENPEVPVSTPCGTLSVSETCLSPLMTYITVRFTADPELLAAYQAENGMGFYSEEGELLWEYGGMDVCNDWLSRLTLVDGNGTILFPDSSGYHSCGSEEAEYVFPYIGNLPQHLYLAPIDNGMGAMEYAVMVL